MSMNKLVPLIQQQVILIIHVCVRYGSESSMQISFGTYPRGGGVGADTVVTLCRYGNRFQGYTWLSSRMRSSTEAVSPLL